MLFILSPGTSPPLSSKGIRIGASNTSYGRSGPGQTG